MYGTVGPQSLVYTSYRTNLLIQLQGAAMNSGTLSTTGNALEFDVYFFPEATSQQIVSQYDGRIVAAQFYSTSHSFTSGSPIVFNSVDFDTHGQYNNSTGEYTIPTSGIYTITGTITGPVSGGTYVYLYVNGSNLKPLGCFNSNGTATLSLTEKFVAGQKITIVANASNSITVFSPVCINLISGAQQILAGQTIAARYCMSATQSVADSVQLNFDTKVYDTTGSVTAGSAGSSGTWKFTAPVTGYYSVDVNAGASGNNQWAFVIYKNGSAESFLGTINGLGTNADAHGHGTVYCLQGDYIDVRKESGTGMTFGTFSGWSGQTISNSNYIEIKQI